jgi:hypothetical protein
VHYAFRRWSQVTQAGPGLGARIAMQHCPRRFCDDHRELIFCSHLLSIDEVLEMRWRDFVALMTGTVAT